MNSIAKIFKDRLIQNYLSKFSKENILDFERKWKRIQNWRKSCIQGDLEHTKETQIQGAFLVQIFDEILGYSTVTSTDSDFFYFIGNSDFFRKQKKHAFSKLELGKRVHGNGNKTMVRLEDIKTFFSEQIVKRIVFI